jgi:hypothetical protein
MAFFFYPQLPSLFLPLRQVAPPAQRFVDERPLLRILVLLLLSTLPYVLKVENYSLIGE